MRKKKLPFHFIDGGHGRRAAAVHQVQPGGVGRRHRRGRGQRKGSRPRGSRSDLRSPIHHQTERHGGGSLDLPVDHRDTRRATVGRAEWIAGRRLSFHPAREQRREKRGVVAGCCLFRADGWPICVGRGRHATEDSAREILDRRYARVEIEQEEYRRTKKDLD